jgi:rhamnose transport system ATP-binding protein
MDEVFEISDTVTILRDGQWISTRPRAELTPRMAIRDMVGRQVVEIFHRERHTPGDVRLKVEGLSKTGAFEDISFEIHAGEVLGFAGLVGARRTDVGLALFGIAPAEKGTVTLDGQPANVTSPRLALDRGIAYSTEDRRQLGLIMGQSISNNIILPSLQRFLGKFGLIKRDEEEQVAETYRMLLKIRAASVDVPTASLSGGNQQKVVISKWLETHPKVLILDEPTRGIDVGAKVEVHQLIDELAGQGMAIMLISSDLPEVLAMSDRILIMREGRQMAILDQSEANQETVLAHAMGQAPELEDSDARAALQEVDALIEAGSGSGD